MLFDNSIPLFVILDINLTMPSVELYTSLFKTAQIVFKLGPHWTGLLWNFGILKVPSSFG